jgi:hypothetical protein
MGALKAWSTALLILLATSAASAGPPELTKYADEQSISIIQLIANPDRFDGKRVEVGGYLELRDEYEHSLFLDKSSLQSGMSANSVAVDLETSPTVIMTRARQLNRSYVSLAGRFKAGSTAFSAGKLSEIYYIAPVSSGDQ